jgi:hypothetical protein
MNYIIFGFWISVITLTITIVIFIYQQEILKKNEQILKKTFRNLEYKS